MKKWTFFTAICLAFILTVVLGVSTPALASSLEKKLYEAAKKEGALEYWDSLSIREVSELWKGFESKYPGIELKFFQARLEESEERYLAEHRAGRHVVDVFPIHYLERFRKNKLLTDLSDIINDSGFPKKFCTKKLDGVGLEHALKGLAYNTNLVSPQEAPRSIEDLLHPKWKGKINLVIGMRYFIYLTKYWGEEKTLAYLRKLARQNPSFTKSKSQTRTLLLAGEFPFTLADNFHKYIIMKAKGAPIGWAKISPIVDTVDAFVILRHAPHPNAAKLFLHWWMSPEGAYYVDARRHKGNPLPGSGTQTSKLIKEAGNPEIIVGASWIDIGQNELLDKCLKAVGYKKDKLRKKKKKK
ncbi:ABC transporter substrate-binding protein [Thermodesulfobacteriota bacterium]